ncbi:MULTISPECIES: SDR family NAD(P)-dependent oxidoreductase [Streptomyces]|uniref:SDR family NAD(P)-dependent oxidoreductase n=1 Tax=Streptomyces TaxID=1883 RepID=UPI00089AC0CC|nr:MULTISPECIES: SDR family oxidoreductase [unclassified Streptomyces]SEB70795.1 NAD(P)-dependent dehydrogenase, short-chain alcohol dehydrogenase family [Streptomyces sp. PAN_FS17]SEE20002.1 NAD(P)-dependent dehydrogenase, short-chain alcohol dehydrogenase family [Streptomyces sp. KS_5]
MLLKDKVAVVYGAGGSIGGAAARAFAREGARVFLAGRTAAPLDKVAEEIRAAGGDAETAVVDAEDEAAVDAFVDGVAARAGRIDVSFNAIGYGDVQKPLMEISEADFLQPVVTAMRSQFLTTRAAARHMTARRAGVILAFGGGGTQTLPGLGGFKIALDALEGLRRQWAIELGPHGIRVVTLKSGGVPESLPTEFPGAEAIVDSLVDATQLGRTATLADVGDVAAFVASDRARTLTATDVNISCGAIVD